MAKFPLSDSERATLRDLEKRYRSGDGMALLEALEMGVMNYRLMPTWALGELLAEIKRYRRGAIRSFGDGLTLPANAMHKSRREVLMPIAGVLTMPVSEFVMKHVPEKPSMVQMWKPLADYIADSFRKVGWPPPAGLSARTLQRIWQENQK